MSREELKRLLVLSHRHGLKTGDWSWAKHISQLREKVKKKLYCSVCGIPIAKNPKWPDANCTCQMHDPRRLAMKAKRWLA